MKTKTTGLVIALLALTGATIVGLLTRVDRDAVDRTEITPEPTEPERGADGCPNGEMEGGMGPVMVRLPPGFCIDTTEVTRAQYDAWLAADPSTAGQPSACSENVDLEPRCDSDDDQPVVCVDWCDARAYCEAAGKRLCGRIGDGEAYEFDAYADATVSEWHAACTSGGEHEYTYGDELDTQVCRGGDAEDHTTWGLVDVGTLGGCHSPESAHSAVYDLSGNAAEWDNACDGDEPDSPCRIRGGAFEYQGVGLRCAMAENLRWPRMRQVVAVGFRCCAN
jgi:formylglycine-generating enzyme required for sulfatase activity